MDENLMEKIQQKLEESISDKQEIEQLAKSMSAIDDSKSFILGLVVGRLYNSFHYQSKRILKRDPTRTEFAEFLEFIKSRKTILENLW